MPKRSRKHTPDRRNNKGGANASTGPSPERRRPDTDYNNDILHLAAELLENAVEQLNHPATCEAPVTTRALWNVAAAGEFPADLIMPTLHMAQQALNHVRDQHMDPTAETFARAATLLRTTTNAQADSPATPSKDAMVPDGRQRDTSIPYWRDNRVTGLRTADHRRARREAKQGLADPEAAEEVRAGKRRRYTDRYGQYDL